MSVHVIGYDYEEKHSTDVDYLELKIILQGVDKTHSYKVPRVSEKAYELMATTAGLIEGKYNRFIIGVSQNTEVILKECKVVFRANPETSKKVQSFYETVVANIEQYLRDPKSFTHSEYEIEGRQLKRIPLEQLIKLRDRYNRIIELEEQGVSTSKTPKFVRFHW